jgi:hypothetical protein
VSCDDKHLSGHGDKNSFIGLYVTNDMKDDVTNDLTDQKTKLEERISDYVSHKIFCSYNPNNDTTECYDECVELRDLDFSTQCPVHALRHTERQLLHLKLPQFLTLPFSTPSIARANASLGTKLIYSEQ